jgi:L-fuculose-phosphate aldolase
MQQTNQQEAQKREQMRNAGIRLVQSGLVSRTWGNISCRLDEDFFLVTPSGREYEGLSAEDMVKVDRRDLSYNGRLKPSSESGLHRAVYQEFPGVGAVIHTHQLWASAFAAAVSERYRLRSIHERFGTHIQIAAYAPSGTEAMSQSATAALRHPKGNAILLRHHGVVCTGTDIDDAFIVAMELEQLLQEEFKNLYREIEQDEFHFEKASYPFTLRYSRLNVPMRPMLDDFAQIVGSVLPVVSETGMEDSAMSSIIEKNALSYYVAALTGSIDPIPPTEARRLRTEYIDYYSKLEQKNR